MLNLIYFVIVLAILIFVHELGHFLVARISGVKILTFSLGFGKKLLTFRRGETEYAISAIPLGGYVKMLGESSEDEIPEEEAHKAFSNKPPLIKMAIAFSGPFFNVLFAALVFFVIFLTGFEAPSNGTRIGQVPKGEPAYSAGLQEGDVVSTIDGRKVSQWTELQKAVTDDTALRPLKFEVMRHGRPEVLMITPKATEEKSLFGESLGKTRPLIGVAPAMELRKESLAGAVPMAVVEAYDWTELTIVGIVKLIKGSISPKNVGGPILIFQQVGQSAKAGRSSFLRLLAIISINLGVVNLLPIPVLDGSHILFSFLEFVIRRKIPERTVEWSQKVGIGILICIMVLATYNDVMRFLHVW
jgi:regulator of sigma E protease